MASRSVLASSSPFWFLSLSALAVFLASSLTWNNSCANAYSLTIEFLSYYACLHVVQRKRTYCARERFVVNGVVTIFATRRLCHDCLMANCHVELCFVFTCSVQSNFRNHDSSVELWVPFSARTPKTSHPSSKLRRHPHADALSHSSVDSRNICIDFIFFSFQVWDFYEITNFTRPAQNGTCEQSPLVLSPKQ